MKGFWALLGLTPDDLEKAFVWTIDGLQSHLGIALSSRLSWLPRVSLTHYSLSVSKPPYRASLGDKTVVALSCDGDAACGSISYIANAIHPLDRFPPSSFTEMCIRDARRPSYQEKDDAPSGVTTGLVGERSGSIPVERFFNLNLVNLILPLFMSVSWSDTLLVTLIFTFISWVNYHNLWRPEFFERSDQHCHDTTINPNIKSIYRGKVISLTYALMIERINELIQICIFTGALSSSRFLESNFPQTLTCYNFSVLALLSCLLFSFTPINGMKLFFATMAIEIVLSGVNGPGISVLSIAIGFGVDYIVHLLDIPASPEEPSQGIANTENKVKLATSHKFTLKFGFYVTISAITAAILQCEYKAALVIVAAGLISSLVSYANRWKAVEVKLNGGDERKCGDVVIYTPRGALVLVRCSREVARDLYFKFMTFDFASSKTSIGHPLLAVASYSVFFLTPSCGKIGSAIIYTALLLTFLGEVLFSLLPTIYKAELQDYFWADITPAGAKRMHTSSISLSRVLETALLGEEQTSSQEDGNVHDKEFSNMVMFGLLRTLDTNWVDGLRVGRKPGQRRAFLAGVVGFKQMRDPERLRKFISYRVKANPKRTAEQYLSLIRLYIPDYSRQKQLNEPVVAASKFHINSKMQTFSALYHVGFFFKVIIELIAGYSFNWDPLDRPEGIPREHQVRVYTLGESRSHQRQFYDDIPQSLAEVLFSFSFSAVSKDSDLTWWLAGTPRVFLHGTTLIEIIAAHKDALVARNTQGLETSEIVADDEVTTTSTVSGEPKGGSADNASVESIPLEQLSSSGSCEMGESSQSRDTTASTLYTTSAETPQGEDPATLFLCIDVDNRESRAQPISMGSNDETTIRALKTEYDNFSTRWPKLKRVNGVKFFRFHSFLQKKVKDQQQIHVHLHKDKQRYPLASDPEYPEYRYSPRPWPSGLPFPVREIAWYLLHPQDCGTSSNLNKMLPARLMKDLATHHPAFGIYVETHYSV